MNHIFRTFVLIILNLFIHESIGIFQEQNYKDLDPRFCIVHDRQQLSLQFSSRRESSNFGLAELSVTKRSLPAVEIAALYDLFNATNGPEWQWTDHAGGVAWDFDSNTNPCLDRWTGITCTSEGEHVTQLDLSDHRLYGTLPDSIGNLSYLSVLTMFHNKIHGKIPSTIGMLQHLTYFDLTNNRLTGQIPSSLRNLTQLHTLFVGVNRLTGSIPSILQYYRNLTRLGLAENIITGTLPSFLSNFTELVFLDLSNNRLEGSILSNIGDLYSLRLLWLSNNTFTGTLPPSLCRIRSLLYLYLSHNQLAGTIPGDIGQLNGMKFLDLDSNQFTGSVPDSFAALTKLVFFGVNHNEISGTIPKYFGNFSHMLNLYLNNNQFTGSIPAEIGNIHRMRFLYLDSNRLHGSIPDSISNMTRMAYLYLYNNSLTGTIPRLIGNCKELELLYLYDSSLTGTIPETLAQLQNLTAVLLQNNRLQGTLEGVFDPSVQVNLITVQVSSNQLTGKLPDSLFRLPSLTTFSAVSNCFEGQLTAAMCNVTALTTLTLDGLRSASSCRRMLLPHLSASYSSDHALLGSIPPCLFSLPSLNTLHLSGNSLSGSLAEDLVIGDSLIDLSLSHNYLTGRIPAVVQSRAWFNLDLSFNRLAGTLAGDASQAVYQTSNFTFRLPTSPTGPALLLVRNRTNAALALENNRLSGRIPAELRSLCNVSLLSGNLFGCRYDKSDLPHNDPNREVYDCGSNSYVAPYTLWLLLTALAAVAAAAILWFRSDGFGCKYFFNMHQHLLKWYTLAPMLSTNLSLQNVCAIYAAITAVSSQCAMYIIMLLLPLYCALSTYYGTHVHQYAWATSIAFLSGEVPFGSALALLLAFLLVVVFIYKHSFRKFKETDRMGPQTADVAPESGRRWYVTENVVVHAIFIAVNTITVLGVNVAFVYVALYESTTLMVAAQVLLSFFKVLWNTVCIRHLLRYIVRYCTVKVQDVDTVSNSGVTGKYFPVLLFVALFNNIAIPCLVVAAISPNCFYNLFNAADPVHSSYAYSTCALQTPGTCVVYVPRLATTTYSPPFTYSYQCSSSFITYYAPAFVYQCITMSILSPGALALCAYWHQRAPPGTVWYRYLDLILPSLWKGLSGSKASDTGVVGICVDNSAKKEMAQSGHEQSSAGMEVVISSSPLHYKSNSTVHSTVLTDDIHVKPTKYRCIDANMALISLLTLLGTLLTFGALFPPLAVTLAVTIAAVAIQWRLKVGRFLALSLEQNRLDCTAMVEQDCAQICSVSVLRSSLWLFVLFACWFYTLFLFDILGDAVGFQRSFWIIIVMAVLPVLLWSGSNLLPCPKCTDTGTTGHGNSGGDNNEMNKLRELELGSEIYNRQN